MSLIDRIKKNPRFYWAASMAIGLTVLFAVDLTMYFGIGSEATLSAAIRSVVAVDQNSIYTAVGGWICGVWFSHFFQFGHRAQE